MTSILSDFRDARRRLIRTPGFTLVAIGALAIGIGLNATLFALFETRLAQPIAGVPDASGVVEIEGRRDRGPARLSIGTYLDYERVQTSLRSAGATTTGQTASIDLNGSVAAGRVKFVTPGYFEALNPAMHAGAGAPAEVPGTAATAFISHAFWVSRLGADPAAIGRPLRVNRVPFIISGIVGRAFRGNSGVEGNVFPEVWLPIESFELVTQPQQASFSLAQVSAGQIVGRLRENVTVEHAEAEANALIQMPSPSSGSDRVGAVLVTTPGLSLDSLLLEAIVVDQLGVLVLAIVSTNVSILLLGRAAARRREIAVRVALGATRGRTIRLLLSESLTLAALSAAAGLLLAFWACQYINAHFPSFGADYQPGIWTMTLTVGVATVTGVLFGLAPALHAMRADVNDALKSGGPGTDARRSRAQRLFVVTEVALSMALVCAAAMLLRTFGGQKTGGNYDASSDVLVADLNLSLARYPVADAIGLVSDLRERLHAVSGIDNVSFTEAFPFGPGIGSMISLRPASDASAPIRATIVPVEPDYFAAMGIPIRTGRDFAGSDSPSVTIVGEELARILWPGQNPTGRSLTFERTVFRRDRAQEVVQEEHVVVGVAATIRAGARGAGVVYVPCDAAAGNLLQAGHHPHRGALAAAGGTDQHQEFLVHDLHCEVLDRRSRVAAAINLGDVLEDHARHGWRSSHPTTGSPPTGRPGSASSADPARGTLRDGTPALTLFWVHLSRPREPVAAIAPVHHPLLTI
jgi:predicted permease